MDTNTTPYTPGYPFDMHPSGLAGRVTGLHRFRPDEDHTRAEDEAVAGKIALYVSRALTDLGRPLPDDLVGTIRVLLSGEVDA